MLKPYDISGIKTLFINHIGINLTVKKKIIGAVVCNNGNRIKPSTLDNHHLRRSLLRTLAAV